MDSRVRILKQKKAWFILVGFIVGFSLVASAITSLRAPSQYPETAIIDVTNGMSLSKVGHLLEDKNIIRSRFWFTNFALLLNGERQVVSGQYYFEKPMNVFQIARRMTSGDFHINQLKTTIPEGTTVSDIALIVKDHYPNFDTVHFLTIAKEKEGFLFPDTYYFGAEVQPEKVVSMMNAVFNLKLSDKELAQTIEEFGRPLTDVITMASILEGEARQTETRRIVAGILWRRMSLGMPLQVDTTFRYVNGKTSKELTLADLKIDSPYNTYVYKGLTPTPISNPGIDSIRAAVTPIETKYLYFLTGDDGTMHYAATLEQHAANKRKYIK